MKSKLIERAEVYEGIAATLRKSLAKRPPPRNRLDARLCERITKSLEEAEKRAMQLRTADRAIKEHTR